MNGMNNANRTEIEMAALELMLAEAVREGNKDLYNKLVSGDESEIEALLDGFFR
jgi:hypothetical protein